MVTPEQIQRLKSLIVSGADADFFFSSIKTARWLPALIENGFFDSPPEPERGGGWVRFPPWPQSGYLARIAGRAPEIAVKAALRIPDTDNAAVNYDLVRVALAVPKPLAIRLLPRIDRWVRRNDFYRQVDDLAKLIVHAADGGAFEGAIKLLRYLLTFVADPDKTRKSRLRGAGTMVGSALEPHSRLEVHDYKELLAFTVPPLVKARPFETLSMLAEVLNSYLHGRHGKDAPPGFDGSRSWRPSIAEHQQNPDHMEASHLVSTLREAGERAVNKGWTTVEQLLALARSRSWNLFKRLALYWARVFRPKVQPEELNRLLLDSDSFFGGYCDLEYGLLLAEAYDALAPGEKEQLFAWAKQGPGAEDLAWMTRTFSGEPATADVIARRVAYWRVNRLVWIKDKLPPPMRTLYDQWVAESSEPEHPGFHVWSGSVQVGFRSPLSAETLGKMPLPQQIDYLRTWEPGQSGWDGPTREGLAATLQVQVKADPVSYLEVANRFTELDPTYVSRLLMGLREGLKGSQVTDWGPFWALARWIIQQPDADTEMQDELTGRLRRGRRWRYSRLEVTRVLCAVLEHGLAVLPLSERASVWEPISALMHDPDPGPEDEKHGGSGSEPFNLSLNTVRGGAVHAVFAFVRWVRSHSPEASQGGCDLNDLPEARDALEACLDSRNEPSLTVRSVFGANLAGLAFWADSWLSEHLHAIFPTEGHDDLWDAAWATFMRVSPPRPKMLGLLRRQYADAITRMPSNAWMHHAHEDIRATLGQHLVLYYCWGDLELEEPDGLIEAFYSRAPDEVRAQVMALLGQTLDRASEPVPSEVLERLVKFWSWRFQRATKHKGEGFREEVAGFAWWFNSNKFDGGWSARQMVAALEISRATERQFLWLKRFAEIAEKHTIEAVRALEVTIQAVRDKAGRFWEDEEAMAILAAAARSGDETVLRHARRAQDLLLGMGRSEYLHTLPEPKP